MKSKETVAVDKKDLKILRDLYEELLFLGETPGWFMTAFITFLDLYDKISLDGRKDEENHTPKGRV